MATRDIIVVTGAGYAASEDVISAIVSGRVHKESLQAAYDPDVRGVLRNPKNRKFLSKQDRLALTAASTTILSSGLDMERLREKCGVFMSVGYIPYEKDEAMRLLENSLVEGTFSRKRFFTDGYDSINPIKAFSCLPNMPAHHVSANFDIQGEYFITYPGTAELYRALIEARERLISADMDYVLLGGVSDQSNFLVQTQLGKLYPGADMVAADAAAFVMLQTERGAEDSGCRAMARMKSLKAAGRNGSSDSASKMEGIFLGAAELPFRVAAALENKESLFEHKAESVCCEYTSTWEIE